jgi:hypothetical protein
MVASATTSATITKIATHDGIIACPLADTAAQGLYTVAAAGGNRIELRPLFMPYLPY